MTKLRVLVLGATGYIGSAIAEALRRAGHDVWCLVRAKDTLSASLLHQRGCRLFIGDVKDSATWIKLADKANAIVFATNLRGDDITTLIEHRANKDLSATAEEPHLADIVLNKTIVYTSGCLVYGADTSKNLIDENSPLSPLAFVSWRPKIERSILSVAKEGSYFGRVVVIRPGFLYGLQGGYLEAFRSYTEHRTAEVVGGGDNFIPTVHAEDLADLYLRVVENPNASGCYNACSDSNDSYYSIIESTARAAAGGQLDISIQHRTPNPSNVMDQMLKVDLFVSSDRARSELGWTHRHLSLVEEADLHFESWKAFRAQQAFFDAAAGASSSVSPAHGH